MDDKKEEETKGNNASTLIGFILFVACGVLVVSVFAIFFKRQVTKFNLRSRAEQHRSICASVTRRRRSEARRRIHRTSNIHYQPSLLTDESQIHNPASTDFETIQHLYRMKALNACKLLDALLGPKRREVPDIYKFLKEKREYLPTPLNVKRVESFCQLYQHAKSEPKAFTRDQYNQLISIVTEFCNIIQGSNGSGGASHIRPIGDIDVLTDSVLESRASSSHTWMPNFTVSIKDWAGNVLRKKKNKQEYQTVPSTESLDRLATSGV